MTAAVAHVQPAPVQGRADALRRPLVVGAWFAAGPVQIHLGVEAEFRPARKAHPALLVEDLDAFMQACTEAGNSVTTDDDLPGFRHCYVDDPFGNRLEFLQPAA